MTRRGAAAQTWHKDYAVRDGESLRYFFNATCEVKAHLYGTLGSHLFVPYSAAREKLLREAFVMPEVETPPRPVFVGHGYIQHAGSEWRDEHFIQHCSYLLSESHGLPDAIAFAHRGSTDLGAEKHLLSLRTSLDQQMEGSDEQPRIINGSRKSFQMKDSDHELSICMLEGENTLED